MKWIPSRRVLHLKLNTTTNKHDEKKKSNKLERKTTSY